MLHHYTIKMKVGEFNNLEILRFTSVGAYLGDENDNDVLLPNKYHNYEMSVGNFMDVFIYRDSEDRLVATTEIPYVNLNSFAFLKIKEVNFFGAFADWGLEKDLMIPFKEQHFNLNEGESYLVTLRRDDATDRLYGSTKLNKFFEPCTDNSLINKVFSLLVGDETDLGVKVVFDNKYSGLIYANDIPKGVQSGDLVEGYIYNIRPDGKVDVRIGQPGYLRIDEESDHLADIIRKQGKLNLTDKSSPEMIMETIGTSKKVFKQALGKLYKEKLVELKEDGVIWIGE